MTVKIGRLLLFQNDCHKSADVHTHRVDAWMMRYLLEHSLALDERVKLGPGPLVLARELDTTQALADLYADYTNNESSPNF